MAGLIFSFIFELISLYFLLVDFLLAKDVYSVFLGAAACIIYLSSIFILAPYINSYLQASSCYVSLATNGYKLLDCMLGIGTLWVEYSLLLQLTSSLSSFNSYSVSSCILDISDKFITIGQCSSSVVLLSLKLSAIRDRSVSLISLF